MVIGHQATQATGGGSEITPADEADIGQAKGAEQVLDPHEGQQLLLIGCQLQSLAKPVTGALGHRHDVTSSAAARA
jgi:hypothetical protein